MKTHLGDVALKNGGTLQVFCVLGPDEDEAVRVGPFLQHKGDCWSWHIEKALRIPLDDLETRFYIGETEGRVAGNICTFENGGVGILGHVFTTPYHRHQGIASGIMNLQMEDFRRRGGKLLTLGTGYGSNAYRIYEGFGFRSVTPESGIMKYSVGEDELEKVERELAAGQKHEQEVFEPRKTGLESSLKGLAQFAEGLGLDVQKHIDGLKGEAENVRKASSTVTVRAVNWGDWPRLNFLFLRHGPPYLRSLAYGSFGITNFEGQFLKLRHGGKEGPSADGWVMLTGDRIPVGFATVTPALLWPGGVWTFDLTVHPKFESEAAFLLDAVEWPSGKILLHTDTDHEALARALENVGFTKECRLSRHLHLGVEYHDVDLWSKEV